MAIELVEKYLPYVDEQFATESKKGFLTNQDFKFTGAHSVKIYKISTGDMNDYGRSGPAEGNWTRMRRGLPGSGSSPCAPNKGSGNTRS